MCTVPDNLNFLPKTLFNDEIFPIDNSFRACELLTGISSSDNENTGTISTVKPISPFLFEIIPELKELLITFFVNLCHLLTMDMIADFRENK